MPEGQQEIRVGLIHFPLLSLGPGLRAGIWLTGCPRRCNGCIAPQWQEEASGRLTTIKQLMEDMRPFLKEADGVTISGGEPFARPPILEALLSRLRQEGVTDILVYSGYSIEELEKKAASSLNLLDALIDGPFDYALPSDSHWRGSANQRLHILAKDPLLRRRYEQFADHIPARRLLQSIPHPCGGTILIGIPKPADLEEIRNGNI